MIKPTITAIDADGRFIDRKSREIARYANNLVPGGTVDNTSVLNALLAQAKTDRWAKVHIGAGAFAFEGEIVVPAQLIIEGAGMAESGDRVGTRFVRTDAAGSWTMTGETQSTPGWVAADLHRNLQLRDFSIHGGGYTTTLVDMNACYNFIMDSVEIANVVGTGLKMTEVWDSRIRNCRFLLLGFADGSPSSPHETEMGYVIGTPGVDIRSPNVTGSDTSNHIYFDGCRFESTIVDDVVANDQLGGILLFAAGGNGSSFYFNNCKFESTESIRPLIAMDNQAGVSFNNVWLFGAGKADETVTVETLIGLRDCRNVRADFFGGWQIGTRGTTVATLTSLAKVIDPDDVEIRWHVMNYLDGFIDATPSMIEVSGDTRGQNHFEVLVPDFIMDDWEADRPGVAFPPTVPNGYTTKMQRIRPAPVMTVSTTTLTLNSSHNGRVIACTHASGCTITVPAGLLPGFRCEVIQRTTSQVTFAASGTTINNTDSHTKTADQYSVVTLRNDGQVDGSGYSSVFILHGMTGA